MLEGYQLIWRLRRGDVLALREAYTKYKDLVYTTAFALVNDPAAARGTVHDAFVALAKDAPNLLLHVSLKSYLAGNIIRSTERILRSSMYKVEEVSRTPDNTEQSDDSAEEAKQKLYAAALTGAMMEVPLPQRQAVALHLFCGLKFPEIAHVLQVNLTTAQSRYGYGLEKLSAVLDRQMEVGGSVNLEDKLRKMHLSIPPSIDQQILNDATAEFERIAKLHVGNSKRIITAAIATALIVTVFAVIMLLTSRGGIQQPQPLVTQRPEIKLQPEETEQPPQPQQPQITKPRKPARRQPPVNDAEAKLVRISSLADTGDITGLIDLLKTDDLTSKMAAIKYLSNMPDRRAQDALNDLAAELDPNNPQDHLLAKALGVEDFGIKEEVSEIETETQTTAGADKPDIKKETLPEKSLAGWLTDEYGYAVAGTIRIGDVNIITDDNGAFSIKGPNFAKIVSPFGFAASDDGRLGGIFYLDNKDQNNLEIFCLPFASASGFVVDVNAQLVNDVRIKIAPDINDFRGELKGPWQIDITDNGSFEITSIPTGFPLVLVITGDGMTVRIPLDDPRPGEHLLLGEIILEPLLKED